MIYINEYKSPIGEIVIAGNEEFITGLYFKGQKYFMNGITETPQKNLTPVIKTAEEWLDIYFSGKIPDFTPPIKISASPFREAVLKELIKIPYGKTVTYGEIARVISENSGKRTSARAVGGAVGRNPISIIIPCHRVMGAGDKLTGYAGGTDKKAALLKIEGVNLKFSQKS